MEKFSKIIGKRYFEIAVFAQGVYMVMNNMRIDSVTPTSTEGIEGNVRIAFQNGLRVLAKNNNIRITEGPTDGFLELEIEVPHETSVL